jgi:hypothetical protein
MTARNATALIDKAVLNGARPMGRTERHTVGGMIGELLAQGIKCSGLKKDQSEFTDHCYLLIRGRFQLAVRFLKGLTHFYSLLITFNEDFDPRDPGGCVSILVDPAPIEDTSVLFGAFIEEIFAELEDVCVLLLEELSHRRSMSSVLDEVVQSGRPLLVVASDIESEALAMLASRCMQAGIKIAIVRTPGCSDHRKAILEDVAVLTGGQLIRSEVGTNIDDINAGLLGRARKVIVSRGNVTMMGGAGTKKAIDARVIQINAQIKKAAVTHIREELMDRLAMFSSGIAVICTNTEAEIEEMKRKAPAETCAMANEDRLLDDARPSHALVVFDQIVAHSLGAQSSTGTIVTGSRIYELVKEPASPIPNGSGMGL